MKTLALDIGNTRTKAALFDDEGLMSLVDRWQQACYDRAIVCASGPLPEGLPQGALVLGPDTRVPIGVSYRRSTLGPDRLAAACGAWALAERQNCIVVDAGTCITADLVQNSTYVGGAILPGIDMSLAALHNLTARLPLVSPEGVDLSATAGTTTEASITLGVVASTAGAVRALVQRYEQGCGPCQLWLTGGDALRLAEWLNDGWHPFRIVDNLVFHGLYEITKFNEEYCI